MCRTRLRIFANVFIRLPRLEAVVGRILLEGFLGDSFMSDGVMGMRYEYNESDEAQ